MDKRKYLTKTLIAEYQSLSNLEDCNFSEVAYRLKTGEKLIEFNGARLSIYGLTIAFNKHIGRKGIYSITDKEYKTWKSIRSREKEGYFIDWEEIREEQLLKDHESVLKCVGSDELPF
ncbi:MULTISPECIES: hypothetical protein [Clostridium]|uniref:Uncharacterized protein n=2 Tax=Clostridium TaxID=1485 RepID=A0A512TQT8_CLOBU|nr:MULTISPECIES: hypothetical protein [Clostridium]MZK54037.1 hypothetical protein [Clostridium beijerinckii]MZK61734.1 hypothetical protein [Clostridium beijerinckii]MZK71452.1 hypothetical protein [Clostridium beijerinckii]MZK75343.1 hypothetical protein [Clostridium beijerinckii]MZK87306.1 hypothetical protein [Clostridium beijerinckii]